MSIEVKFKMYVDDENCLSEDLVVADINVYRPGIIQGGDIEGAILVSSPDIPGGHMEIQDNLGVLAKRLCFEGVARLVAEQTVEITFFTYYAKLKLQPENEFIVISGDHVPEVKLSRLSLLPALYHCGQRYLSLLRLLSQQDPYYPDRLKMLEELSKVTEQALRNAGMI